jgi:hypothetical protein
MGFFFLSKGKPGVRIATNSFKLEEVQFLTEVIRKKYNLDCTIQKIGTISQHSIYIKGSSGGRGLLINRNRQLVIIRGKIWKS